MHHGPEILGGHQLGLLSTEDSKEAYPETPLYEN